MNHVQIKLVSFRTGGFFLRFKQRKAEAEMQNLFNQGFLLLRGDICRGSIVYVFTRTPEATFQHEQIVFEEKVTKKKS